MIARGGLWFSALGGLSFLWAVLALGGSAGCGSDDSDGEGPAQFCESLSPCETVGCRMCDWPQGTCRVDGEEIYSISLPASGRKPYSIVLDVVVPSSMSLACPDPEIVVRSPAGEIARRALDLDENNRVCAVSGEPGRHAVLLVCPAYPVRAGYRISVVDSRGNRIVP